MDDPTLDELIAWAEREVKWMQRYHQKMGVSAVSGGHLQHYQALAAALRELRQLREGVARVAKDAELLDAIAESDALHGSYYAPVLANIADRIRALTPEGTT